MWLNSTEVVILAGGASRRMRAPFTGEPGSPKALLHFSVRETFLDHLLAMYRAAGVERATVVWPEPARRDARVIHSIAQPSTISLKTSHVFHKDPCADRLASVVLGLREANPSRVFLQDVDRPFITSSVIRSLLTCETAINGGYIAPDVFGHAGHPLLLSPEVVQSLLAGAIVRESPTSEVLTLRDLLLPFAGTLVPVGSMEEAFFLTININTPAEYHRFFPSGVDERSSTDVSLKPAPSESLTYLAQVA